MEHISGGSYVGSTLCLTRKYQTRLERLGRAKHSISFDISDKANKFNTNDKTCQCFEKIFVTNILPKKLECLSLTRTFWPSPVFAYEDMSYP